MVKSIIYFCMLFLFLLCIAADDREQALQSGYRAYLEKDFDSAIRQYEIAMLNSDDPGKIACELGAILAQAERFQESAQYFTRSLEDAQGIRRVKAAYGQATALTKVAEQMQGRRAVALLQRALPSYEMALRELATLSADEAKSLPEMKAHAEHNRGVAQALLARKQKEPDPPDNQEDPDPSPLLNPRMTDTSNGQGLGRGATPLSNRQPQGSGSETGNNDSTAGRGNLPPLPDEDQANPLSPEEAHRRLDELLKRLRTPPAPRTTKPGTRDW